MEIDLKRNYLIMDMPSAETADAKPISKGETLEVFFAFKNLRYLIDTRVLGHTKFKMASSEINAFVIRLPGELKDGDKREYFRVQSNMRPPVTVLFHIYEKGAEKPVMSNIVKDTPTEFFGDMIDISGGGFSIRTKLGQNEFLLDKGDVVFAKFQLKKDTEEMTVWADVRSKRKYKGTAITVWGFMFMENEKNRQLRFYRNKIMRYVTERQREMLK
ncbi:MAG: hypothetical protein GY757_27375 [bacterium]|nr:hypothetical protein [bacterium]